MGGVGGGGKEGGLEREVAKESNALSWTILEVDIWWPKIIKGLEKHNSIFTMYDIAW